MTDTHWGLLIIAVIEDYELLTDRQEKRARALGLPWPPYVVLGCRVFYSRQRTKEWFAAQEAKSLVGGKTP
jgi:hypothetical protein